MIEGRFAEAVRVVGEQLTKLNELVGRVNRTRDVPLGREQLKRWKSHAVELLKSHVHPLEAEKLQKKDKYGFTMNPLVDFNDEVGMYSAFLTALVQELAENPARIVDMPREAAEPRVPAGSSNAVFIVHGHDELNVLRLKELLHERFQLNAIVLRAQAGKGRTLIEKFEEEAENARFAFALLTPDDIVLCEDEKYAQARPNVVFELGWFYGRLGRERVVILFKKGTRIHSDLDGISRIEFSESVETVVPAIEKEMHAAGLLPE
jgi:predicted nucleotide-binding protein